MRNKVGFRFQVVVVNFRIQVYREGRYLIGMLVAPSKSFVEDGPARYKDGRRRLDISRFTIPPGYLRGA